MQKLIIIGNVGTEPEMRYTPSGQAVTSFNMATNRKYKKGDETVKETTWFRVTAWGKPAEIAKQYVKKGNQLYVEGRLTPDKATGKPRIWKTEAGDPKADYEVTLLEMEFLGGGSKEAPAGAPAGKVTADENEIPSEDDIPF